MDLPICFEQIDPDRNRARFYVLDCAVTLFGDVVVLRRWGRIGTCGRQMQTPVAGPVAATDAIARLAEIRGRRGYRIVDAGRRPPNSTVFSS